MPAATVHAGLKAGQLPGDLREVDPVVALVGGGSVGEGHRRPEPVRDHHRDVADLDDVLVPADVVGLVVDDLAGRLERREEGARDVLGVHQRSPRAAVALEPHLSAGEGRAGQVVDHDVGAQAWRRAVRGRVAQVGRAEVVVGEPRDGPLGPDLALAVGRHGVQRALLGHRGVAGGSVERARGREQEPGDARGLGDLRHVEGTLGVDGVRRLRVQVPDRVVGDGSQVHHRVEPGQVVRGLVADVTRARLVARGLRAEVAAVVPPGVEAHDLVPGGDEVRDENRADVAAVTVDENAHGAPSLEPSGRRAVVAPPPRGSSGWRHGQPHRLGSAWVRRAGATGRPASSPSTEPCSIARP